MRTLLDLMLVACFIAINFVFIIGTPLAAAVLIHRVLL